MGLQIIHENVEKTLIETARLCQKMNVPLRCIHLNLMDKNIHAPPEEWQNAIQKSIETAHDNTDTESILYLYADGDMTWLSRTATRKTFLRLLELLPRTYVPDPEHPGLAQIFELHLESAKLIRICEEKIRVAQAHAAQIMVQKQADLAQKREQIDRDRELDIRLNTTLIASFSARRNERKEPGVLVVEDDLFSQKLVSNALRAAGHTVYTAGTSRAAIQAMIKNAPDMILLDIELPDVTGLEIISEIKEIDKDAYIVMLSGNGSKENVMRAISQGAKGFIGKPFTLEKLGQASDKCPFIAQKRATKEPLHA